MREKEPKHVRFYLRSYKKNESKIRASISVFHRKAEITTGLIVDPAKWDRKTQRTKPNTKHQHRGRIITGQDLDAILNKIARDLSRAANLAHKHRVGVHVSTLEVITRYKELSTKDSPIEYDRRPFLYYFDDFIKAGKRGALINESGHVVRPWNQETIRRYENLIFHWERFNIMLPVGNFNIDLLDGFVQHLISQNLGSATIEKLLKILKRYIKFLIREKHLPDKIAEELKTYRPGLRQISQRQRVGQVVYLTISELKQIQNAEIPPQKQYLQRTRDIFLFNCLAGGLRVSDLQKLKKESFDPNTGQHGVIRVVSEKGQKPLMIPLDQTSRGIVDKYANLPGGKLLPTISATNYRIYLKELARIAQINSLVTYRKIQGNKPVETTKPKHELISTHTARRSFINLSIQKGIRPEIVSQITGTSLKIILEYYRGVGEDEIINAYSDLL